MNNKGNLTDKRPPFLPTFIGTGFGSGLWPWGPGTAGSVMATLIWALLTAWGGVVGSDLQAVTLFLAVLFTIIGTWATAQLQPYWGEDPSRVVVDEMVGVWIPLSLLTGCDFAHASWADHSSAAWPGWALAALVLFRLFDMTKPLGIKRIDRKSGAFYVMLDDIVAGIYAAIVLMVLRIAWI